MCGLAAKFMAEIKESTLGATSLQDELWTNN